MNPAADPLSLLRAINDSAAFNRRCGFQVERAAPGAVEPSMPWRAELGQYSGFLQAPGVHPLRALRTPPRRGQAGATGETLLCVVAAGAAA